MRSSEDAALRRGRLPVEVVFHPSWWHRHAGIDFDEGFFYDPRRRVADERTMERVLYEKFGDLGLGEDRDLDRPVLGPVHNAAGYLLSEMIGCRVEYRDDAPPQVIPAQRPDLEIDVEAVFRGEAFLRLKRLVDDLKTAHGRVVGDVNWGGILNLALDVRGQDIFLDLVDRPELVRLFFGRIAEIIDRFTAFVESETGTTSISVNRLVRHLPGPVFLHSECALTMISAEHYRSFIMPFDRAWSLRRRPFGIHYCGPDAHRFAGVFAELPHLDLLDVGWGGDLGLLREKLPGTFLNIRLSPVEIVDQNLEDIRRSIEARVAASGDLRLTGVCCINMDDRVSDDRVRAIFETVFALRRSARAGASKRP
ncbi:MAG TPA: hypothetical protein VKT17_09935 [Acidobacteriota bacterium]|nr:hypothetical protein [Acidobacteriota bacterium]